MVVRMLGARAIAALMRADLENEDVASGVWLEALAYGAGEEAMASPRNAESREDSAVPSRVSHSQTTSTAQPDAESAAVEAASRATLRAILLAQ